MQVFRGLRKSLWVWCEWQKEDSPGLGFWIQNGSMGWLIWHWYGEIRTD